jgi:hypothetical protein
MYDFSSLCQMKWKVINRSDIIELCDDRDVIRLYTLFGNKQNNIITTIRINESFYAKLHKLLNSINNES